MPTTAPQGSALSAACCQEYPQRQTPGRFHLLLSGKEGSRPQEEEQAGVFEVPVIVPPNPTPFPCVPSLPSPRGLREQGQQGQPLHQHSQNKTLMEIMKEGGEKREQGQDFAHIIPSGRAWAVS